MDSALRLVAEKQNTTLKYKKIASEAEQKAILTLITAKKQIEGKNDMSQLISQVT